MCPYRIFNEYVPIYLCIIPSWYMETYMIIYSHEEQDSPISTPLVVSPIPNTKRRRQHGETANKILGGKQMEEKRLTPIKAIRAKCLDCCCGNSNEVKLCTCTGCALYPYREGHNPFIQKQEWTEERTAAQKARMAQNIHSPIREKSAN